jgi:hypothetical protein
MKVLVHPQVQSRIDGIVARPGGTHLIHGAVGSGKRTLALEIARRLNCDGCTDASCRSCVMIAGGNHPDIITVAPDEKGKIGIEAIHELQHSLQYQQYQSDNRRVAVILNAETLTLPAENALLKTLEEPPAGTTLIVTASTPSALLPTVLSRTSQLFLPPVDSAALSTFLQEEFPDTQAHRSAIIELSHGAPGLAVRYATDPDKLQHDIELAAEVRQALLSPDLFMRLQATAAMAARNEARSQYIDELTRQSRLQARQEGARTAAVLTATQSLRERLAANVSPKTAFEALAVEIA